MIVEELSIESVRPYEKNPRKNDKAVDGVAESIKQPIVIDKNGVIVVGHTRYKARSNWDSIPFRALERTI